MSLRFAKTFYGILFVISFLTQECWIIALVGVLMIMGTFSVKFNLPYRFHLWFVRSILNKKETTVRKGQEELSFVCVLAGGALLFGYRFPFLYFGKFVSFFRGMTLIVSAFMFLSGFAGICAVTVIYILFKNFIAKRK